MSAWNGEWENAISVKLMDSVQEDTLAVFVTGMIVDNKHSRALLFHRRRHRLTEESFRKALAPGQKVLQEGKVRKRVKVTSKEVAQIRRVIIGILPYLEITYLNRDANYLATKCLFRHTEADRELCEKSKKSGARISCFIEGV